MTQNLYDRVVRCVIENQNKFYRLAFSYVQNQEDALDAVQSAVCKALEHYGDKEQCGCKDMDLPDCGK